MKTEETKKGSTSSTTQTTEKAVLLTRSELNKAVLLTQQKRTREYAIERYLCNRVKALGGIALKMNSTSGSGWPDRVVLLPSGIVLWVELKSLGERPRKLQESAHRRLMALGQTVCTADSREKVDKLLAQHTHGYE